jgi:4-hydroxy-tetrahydrodipicolinate reductase
MPKKIKYGLIGFSGKLGSEVESLFAEKNHQLVFMLNKNNEKKVSRPDVLIDCSLATGFDQRIYLAESFKCPLITAVTGLSEYQIKILKKLSKKVPVVQSYNFSIGIQILLHLTEVASKKLDDWDVEIVEAHHRFKKDKPSGTAKMIEKIFDKKRINISSLRLGGVVGEHAVSFGSGGEVLSISHAAISRRTFAEGILRSAHFVKDKKNGYFTFADVIFK